MWPRGSPGMDSLLPNPRVLAASTLGIRLLGFKSSKVKYILSNDSKRPIGLLAPMLKCARPEQGDVDQPHISSSLQPKKARPGKASLCILGMDMEANAQLVEPVLSQAYLPYVQLVSTATQLLSDNACLPRFKRLLSQR